jgi:hypothetical protein
METPASGPRDAREEPSTPDSPPEPGDREVVAFLRAVLLPALGDRVPRVLREAVRQAVRDQRLDALERLSGRHRQELLQLLEQVSETRRARPSPGVLVRLTTVISSIPASPELTGVSAARPAR